MKTSPPKWPMTLRLEVRWLFRRFDEFSHLFQPDGRTAVQLTAKNTNHNLFLNYFLPASYNTFSKQFTHPAVYTITNNSHFHLTNSNRRHNRRLLINLQLIRGNVRPADVRWFNYSCWNFSR